MCNGTSCEGLSLVCCEETILLVPYCCGEGLLLDAHCCEDVGTYMCGCTELADDLPAVVGNESCPTGLVPLEEKPMIVLGWVPETARYVCAFR